MRSRNVLCLLFPLLPLAWATMTCPSKEELIDSLQLDDNQLEGVFFRETFRASTLVQAPQGERSALSARYYLEKPSGDELVFTRLQSDETLHYSMGTSMTIFSLGTEGGVVAQTVLGPDVMAGDVLQFTKSAGAWYASIVNSNNDNSSVTLIGSVVGPGWEARDLVVANSTELFEFYPQAIETLSNWLHNSRNIPVYCNVETLPTVGQLVELRDLEPHPEGGYFRETFRSSRQVEAPWGNRSAMTAIDYLMTVGEHSDFHRLTSDETWSFYLGDPVSIYLLEDELEGNMETIVLGSNGSAGQVPQFTVPANAWLGAEVVSGGPAAYGFVGTNVGPGFDFTDWELGVGTELAARFPEATDTILRLTPSEEGNNGDETDQEASAAGGGADDPSVAPESSSAESLASAKGKSASFAAAGASMLAFLLT